MADHNAFMGLLTAENIRAAQKLFGLSDRSTIGDLKREQKRFGDEYSKLLKIMEDPSTSPFAHLANVDLSRLKRGGAKSNTSSADRQMDDDRAIAREIIRAGAKARGESGSEPAPIGTTAKLILLAGRKRRGET